MLMPPMVRWGFHVPIGFSIGRTNHCRRPGSHAGLADYHRILPPWDRLITLLRVAAFISLAVIYYKLLPTTKVGNVLAVVTLADVVTVLSLPIIWVVKPAKWPKGMPLIATGLVVSLVLQAACAATAAMLEDNGGNYKHRRSSLRADWHGILFWPRFLTIQTNANTKISQTQSQPSQSSTRCMIRATLIHKFKMVPIELF